MQKGENKKGISPLIATVLIVGLVVVLGALIALFLTRQVKGALEKQPDCGAQEILNTEMGIRCSSPSANTCEVTFINNGQEKIDLARVVATNGGQAVSPAATFINLEPGAEFPVTYNTPCESVKAYPGKVITKDGNVKATLCVDKEVNAQCQ